MVLGGPGIFYLWLSFYSPVEAMKAMLCIGAATILNFMIYPEVLGEGRGFVAVGRLIARVAALLPRR